jgi:hypothetical protein
VVELEQRTGAVGGCFYGGIKVEKVYGGLRVVCDQVAFFNAALDLECMWAKPGGCRGFVIGASCALQR